MKEIYGLSAEIQAIKILKLFDGFTDVFVFEDWATTEAGDFLESFTFFNNLREFICS